MSLVTNVFRRGATYYFRIRVPVRLRVRVGRNELWKSLRTSLASEARRRCVMVQNLTEALWRDLERVMDLSECKTLIDAWLAAEIKEDAYLRGLFDGEEYVAVVMRREPPWKPDTLVEIYDHEQLAHYQRLTPEKQQAQIGPDHYVREGVLDRELTVDGYRKVFADGEARAVARNDEIAVQHVRELFAREKVEVSEFSDLFEAATKMMLRAQGDLAKVIRDRDAVGWEEWVTDDPASELLSRLPAPPEEYTLRANRSKATVAEKTVKAGLLLSEAAEKAIPEIARIEDIRPKRVEDYRSAVATFIDWWGFRLELRERAEDIQHEPAFGLGRVDPALLKASEANALRFEPINDLPQVNDGTRQSIKPSDDENVALANPGQCRLKLLTPFGGGPRDLLGEHLLTFRFCELSELNSEVLSR